MLTPLDDENLVIGATLTDLTHNITHDEHVSITACAVAWKTTVQNIVGFKINQGRTDIDHLITQIQISKIEISETINKNFNFKTEGSEEKIGKTEQIRQIQMHHSR